MDNELETIQQIYNVVVEFIINYSIQILGAIIILVISAKLAGWLGRLVTGLCEKKVPFPLRRASPLPGYFDVKNLP